MQKNKKKDEWELTPTQLRKLKVALADLRDRTRWVIADDLFGKGCWLIWNAGDDTTLMHWTRKRHGHPKPELLAKHITVFKRREHAEAMLKFLLRTRKYLKKHTQVLRCTLSKEGTVVKLAAQGRKTGT